MKTTIFYQIKDAKCIIFLLFFIVSSNLLNSQTYNNLKLYSGGPTLLKEYYISTIGKAYYRINPDYAVDNSGGWSNLLIFSKSPSI